MKNSTDYIIINAFISQVDSNPLLPKIQGSFQILDQKISFDYKILWFFKLIFLAHNPIQVLSGQCYKKIQS